MNHASRSLHSAQRSALVAESAASDRLGAATTRSVDTPLIAHIVYRFDVGGLENGVVNLINRLPAERFRHVVIALTESTQFRQRIGRRDVAVHELHKRPGQDLGLFLRLWRLLRQIRPDVVHTRNLATLECQVPAALAGVKVRLHGEHGRDVQDLEGRNARYRMLRRLLRPLIHRYIALSADLERYLRKSVDVPAGRIVRICNGVDFQRFRPREASEPRALPAAFAPAGCFVIGTIGRLEPVKDQLTLARAFARLIRLLPDHRDRLRLVLVGDGSLRSDVVATLRAEGVSELAWLPGARDDIPELMRSLDLFVLPSLAEGISNTLLEAAASGLPSVATRVGGNAELVEEDVTGALVAAADAGAMAATMARYILEPALAQLQGHAARERAVQHFSLEAMVGRYQTLYEEALRQRGQQA